MFHVKHVPKKVDTFLESEVSTTKNTTLYSSVFLLYCDKKHVKVDTLVSIGGYLFFRGVHQFYG